MIKPRIITAKQGLIRTQMKVIAAVLISGSLVFSVYSVNLILGGFKDRVQRYAELVTESVLPALAFHDQSAANQALNLLRRDQSFVSARIIEKDGKQFAFVGPSSEIARQAEADSSSGHGLLFWFLPDIYQHSMPLEQDGAVLGFLVTSYSTEDIQKVLRTNFIIVLTTLLIGLGVSYLIGLRTLSVIAKPMEMLQKSMRRVSQDSDYSQTLSPLKEASNIFEIREIITDFDEMLRQIQNRDSIIRDANENLERRIEERTEELVQAQQALVQTAKMSALGELSAGIAHEINNPVAVITGRCTLMLKNIKKGEVSAENISRDLEKITTTANRITKIISGLKTFARDGQRDPFEPYDLNLIIDESMDLCSERIRNMGIELRISKLSAPLLIDCRPTQLSQVIVNLVNNGRDAIENLQEKWIEVKAQQTETSVQIQVTDSGHGISPEVAKKLMSPFFTTKPVGKGTGLGLSISRGIIESHQGKFTLDESHPHTRFVIEIPIHQRKKKTA